jgi:hypothetical protein
MQRNSFKARPPGFTEHFPETKRGGNKDIRYSANLPEARNSKAYAVSPRLLDDLVRSLQRPQSVREVFCISDTALQTRMFRG